MIQVPGGDFNVNSCGVQGWEAVIRIRKKQHFSLDGRDFNCDFAVADLSDGVLGRKICILKLDSRHWPLRGKYKCEVFFCWRSN